MAVKYIYTDNFGDFIEDTEPSTEAGDLRDARTGIYVRNPYVPSRFDMEGLREMIPTYYNYLQWVQKLLTVPSINPQPGYMLNLGYLPVALLPSFWPAQASNQIRLCLAEKGFRVHTSVEMRIFTSKMFKAHQNTSGRFDYWVNRLDAVEKLGGDIATITTQEVLKYALA